MKRRQPETPPASERLQKILSRAGVASRRAAETLMEQGRVTVNGETAREPGTRAEAGKDDIRVDGVRVRLAAAHVYILLNKPRGVVTTRHDPEKRSTVMDLVPAVAGLFPVGRLDVSTEGLMLLTTDGDFAERVAHPRFQVPRVYHAKVYRVPAPEILARLRQGVRVEGERLAVDQVRVLHAGNNAWLELTLHEGKHHEVRRLLKAVGHPVSKLKRMALGPLTTRGLNPGEFRHLRPAEVEAFLEGGTTAPAVAPPAVRPAPRAARAAPRTAPPAPRVARPAPRPGRAPQHSSKPAPGAARSSARPAARAGARPPGRRPRATPRPR
jgi:23S rRNA pseudouridine2605 synthase